MAYELYDEEKEIEVCVIRGEKTAERLSANGRFRGVKDLRSQVLVALDLCHGRNDAFVHYLLVASLGQPVNSFWPTVLAHPEVFPALEARSHCFYDEATPSDIDGGLMFLALLRDFWPSSVS